MGDKIFMSGTVLFIVWCVYQLRKDYFGQDYYDTINLAIIYLTAILVITGLVLMHLK